ncbi:MAG TPA: hypothetical protein VNT52_01345, partial [Acidimicrobiales bacterium]|nr:hypothetical protein [Acidimicrobiales bacterium]
MRGKALALGLATVMAFGACGDDNDSASLTTTVAPATTTTLSQIQLDEQKANRIVLTAADLTGFSIDPPDPSDVSPEFEAAGNACAKNNPLWVRLAKPDDPRGAVSHFSKGDLIGVQSSVTFADDDDQARTAMADVSAPSFASCFSNALAAELRREPGYTNVSVTTAKLPAMTVGDQSIGYRSTARFRVQGTSVT